MNIISKELIKIAKELVAIKFKTQKELEDYKKNHTVRKDTKLEVEKSDNKEKSQSGNEKSKSIKKTRKLSQKQQSVVDQFNKMEDKEKESFVSKLSKEAAY